MMEYERRNKVPRVDMIRWFLMIIADGVLYNELDMKAAVEVLKGL